jgi:Tfp pilus assembly protein PilV
MTRRILLVLSLGLSGLVAAAASTYAQTQSSQPAPNAQLAPANSASAQSPGQDSPAPTAPAKKVWTNEDMGKSQAQPEISTFKSADSKNANAAAKPHPAHPHDPGWYRDQIARLQAQIPPLDKQIAAIQSAIDGKPTGDTVQSTRPAGVKWDTWQHELADAKQKREDILDKISALHDQARHDGVNPNQLP